MLTGSLRGSLSSVGVTRQSLDMLGLLALCRAMATAQGVVLANN